MNQKLQHLKNKRLQKQESKEQEKKEWQLNSSSGITDEMQPPTDNKQQSSSENRPSIGGISKTSKSQLAFYANVHNQNQNIVADEDARQDLICDDCGERALRYKVAEGTLVCMACGLVAQSSIIDPTNETRNFSEPTQNNVVSRTGDLIRMDQMNYLITEFTGNQKSGARQANALSMRSTGESHILATKKKRDWYRDYFNTIKKKLKIKQNGIDLAMSKVEKILEAKTEGMSLTGSREAYAANIMKLVSNELDLEIKMDTIRRFTPNLEPAQITKAHKKLNRTFKEWYKTTTTPHSMLPQYSNKLGFPPQLAEDGVYIAKQIHKGGQLEGCQPLTIVGVALHILNSRLPLNTEFAKYQKREEEIANVVTKGTQTITHNIQRIQEDVAQMLPDKYLTEMELKVRHHQPQYDQQLAAEQAKHQQQHQQQNPYNHYPQPMNPGQMPRQMQAASYQ